MNSPPPDAEILSVGQLTLAIKNLLEGEFPAVWVEGEVSNLARPASGHVYLTLRDDAAPLKAVVYRGVALRMRFDLTDGMKVVVRGRLTLYPPRGEYQLLCEEVLPKGIGPLELAFRQMREKLFVAGYFAPERKKPIPRVPRRIALVTSPTGSAVRDMLEVLARRWPATDVWVVPVRVQGDEAAAEIAAALGLLNRMNATAADGSRIDLILLARGGGSLEDLWPFNEEVVAHAIFRSRLPVMTGIGHEDDLTIADLVADRRALTPTEAAERSVPDRQELLGALDATASRLRAMLLRLTVPGRERLQRLMDRPCFKRPAEKIDDHRRRVGDLAGRAKRAFSHYLDDRRGLLLTLAGKLDGLSPLKVLGRGYTLTRKLDDLDVVRSVRDVKASEWIVTETADGRIVSQVASAVPTNSGGRLPFPEDDE